MVRDQVEDRILLFAAQDDPRYPLQGTNISHPNGKLGKSSSTQEKRPLKVRGYVNVTSLDLCWKSTRKKLGGGFKHFNISPLTMGR